MPAFRESEDRISGNLGFAEILILAVVIAAVSLVVKWIRKKPRIEPEGILEFKTSLRDEGRAESTRPQEPIVAASASPAKTPSLPARPIAKVFLAYRRDDSADVTGRIYDRLVQHFGKEQVFKDVDSIPIGIDFRRHLEKVVGDCENLLVVIGDRWLTAQHPTGAAKLDDTNDFVRIEIEIGLRRDIRVVPILVKGAQMPLERDLPDSIKELAYRNGIAVRVDPDFHNDMDRLISGLS